MSDLNSLWVQTHRGAGGDIAKDNALSSIDFAIQLLPRGNRMGDADLAITSDGVLVLMHDDTVNRTTNGTGDVTTLTLAQIKALVLKEFPYSRGVYGTEQVPTFDEYLDKLQANNLIGTPEIKDNSTSIGAAVAAKIVARGMRDQVTVGSFWPNSLKASRAAGIRTYIPLSGNNISTLPNASTFLTCLDGFPPYYCCFNSTSASVTDAYLSALIAGGVKMGSYTANRRTELAAIQARLTGLGGTLEWYTSDSPFYTHGLITPNNSLLATDLGTAKRYYVHGLINSTYANSKLAVVTDDGHIRYGDGNNPSCNLVGEISRSAAPSRFRCKMKITTLDSTSTRWGGLAYFRADDRTAMEGLAAASNFGIGPGALLRQNGSLEAFDRTADTTATTYATLATGGAVTAGEVIQWDTIRSGTTLTTKITRGGTDYTVSGSITSPMGGFQNICKSGLLGQNVEFWDFETTP